MLIIGHVISKKHDTLATIFISLCETPAHSHLELWRKAGVSMQHMESFSWSRTTETYFFPHTSYHKLRQYCLVTHAER